MTNKIQEFIEGANNFQTTFGKVVLGLDTFGAIMSVGFYGLGWASLITSIFPPIILVLTVISISLGIIFKISAEYREWKKRNSK
tara:strand:+ start:444 stop:695 length:252 start_codon:yes stop_codon:yes gene_type:complete